MIGERILARAEKRILGGWVRGSWRLGRDLGGSWSHDGDADFAYCLTGALGYSDATEVDSICPSLRVVTDAVYLALPPKGHYHKNPTRRERYSAIMYYNDSFSATFESIVETIRRAQELLPFVQPGNPENPFKQTTPVAS